MKPYDLHTHSHRSYDSPSRPAAIIRRAIRRGLAGIAITDHGTIAGGLACRALAPPDLLVIVGAEIYTEVGDIVGLFLEREITSRDPIRVIADIHDQGGIAFLPHPLRGHPPVIDESILAAVDAYEAFNARAGRFEPTTARDWVALGGKAALGCSDAHFPGEIGNGVTLMPGEATTDNVRTRLTTGETRWEGELTPAWRFYASQMVKVVKTRDLSIVARFVRRRFRRLTT